MNLRMLGLGVLLVVSAALGWWAGRVAFVPPSDPLQEGSEMVTYRVEIGTVGRSISYTALADWPLEPVGRHSGAGVVTSVVTSPGELGRAGDVLYTVDLRPVVLAEGGVPMFRPLSLRTRGEDVAQLQQMLATLGVYDGEIDATFGATTRDAVRSWQSRMGVDDTGIVQPGDLVFVDSLPVRIVLSELVTPGARLNDGESVVFALDDVPLFRIPVSPEQADLVPLSGAVMISYVEGTWDARIDRAVETDSGQIDLVLTGLSGKSVCGNTCSDWVELAGTTRFRTEVVVVPETTGPVVPVGAVSTDATNNPSVTLADGAKVPITIVESAQGIAVVDGVEAGTVILMSSGT